MVFLVDPDEKLAAICTLNPPVIRPVSACSSSCKECRTCRFLEEVAIAT